MSVSVAGTHDDMHLNGNGIDEHAQVSVDIHGPSLPSRICGCPSSSICQPIRCSLRCRSPRANSSVFVMLSSTLNGIEPQNSPIIVQYPVNP